MPRVSLKKKEYMIVDLPGWIQGRMHRLGLKQKTVARELGISQPAFSLRLKPQKGKKIQDIFSYGDLLTLFECLEATDEEILRIMRLTGK